MRSIDAAMTRQTKKELIGSAKIKCQRCKRLHAHMYAYVKGRIDRTRHLYVAFTFCCSFIVMFQMIVTVLDIHGEMSYDS